MPLTNHVGTLYGPLRDVVNAGYVAVADVRGAEIAIYWHHSARLYRLVVDGRGIRPPLAQTSSPSLRGMYYAAARIGYPINSGIEWMASDIRPRTA
jgi:hypothetical protein